MHTNTETNGGTAAVARKAFDDEFNAIALEVTARPQDEVEESIRYFAQYGGEMVGHGFIERSDVEDRLWRLYDVAGLVDEMGPDVVKELLADNLNYGVGSVPAVTAGDGEEVDPDLAEMNAKYGVTDVGGKTRVVCLKESLIYPGCKIPVYKSLTDFRAFHDKTRKVIRGEDGKERKVGIGSWWIKQEGRQQYEGVVYAPGAETTGRNLNLWTGFGCKPVKGDWGKYRAHLLNNVCSGVEAHSAYLLNWMAYAVQHPGRQGETAVVMRGAEGVGKGVLAKEFGRLFGSHYRHISQAGHLTGHFNAHLQQCSVLFADEAFFAGDRSHESILKALITEETLMIEPKGVDSYPVRNCLHLIMSSNSDWVIPAGADARRYFVVTVSDAHKQDYKYFAAITKQMNDGGREALLHDLLKRDLSAFNVRNVPKTDALADQKALSRTGIDRLVEILAHEGILPSAHSMQPHIAVTSGEVKGEGFYAAAKKLVPDLRRYGTSIQIATALSQWGCKSWHSGNQRGIEFPTLAEVRAQFEAKHGVQPWPIDPDNPNPDWSWGE